MGLLSTICVLEVFAMAFHSGSVLGLSALIFMGCGGCEYGHLVYRCWQRLFSEIVMLESLQVQWDLSNAYDAAYAFCQPTLTAVKRFEGSSVSKPFI